MLSETADLILKVKSYLPLFSEISQQNPVISKGIHAKLEFLEMVKDFHMNISHQGQTVHTICC